DARRYATGHPCNPPENPYNAASARTRPGAERTAACQSAGGGANRPGVPCSRLLSFRAFPNRARRARRRGGPGKTERHSMPLYEHVFLARRDLSAQQVEELTAQYKGVIEQMGGKIAKSEYWGVKSLTYRMRKNRKAHFTLMNVDAPAAAHADVERQHRINEDILRQLTIRVEEHEAEPSAMMRKADRDRDRDDRRGGFGDRDRGGFGDRERSFGDRERDRGERGERRPRG